MSQVNETSTSTWREKLREWLRTNPRGLSNPRKIPEELLRLREDFVRRFPKEKLRDLTLEDYALGLESKDGFCYWLEQTLADLGRIGAGPAWKFGVWWSRSDNAWRWAERYSGPADALAKIKEGLSALVEAVEESRFKDLDRIDREYFGRALYPLRCKPLSLYFPDHFLPITQPKHLASFMKEFGEEPRGELLTTNRQLLQLIRGFREFEDFDTFGMMLFLYDSYPPKKLKGEDVPPAPAPENPSADVPRQLKELMDITARTHNVLLYGPPGVGKTWLVNHFTNYFLLSHNHSQAKAEEYWRKRSGGDGARRDELRTQAREAADADRWTQPSFWWMVANEETSDWRWETLFERREWFFEKRNLARNFAAAKPGDFVFGYQAGSRRQVVALVRIASPLETSTWDGQQKEGILLKPVQWLSHPLDWKTVAAAPRLKESEPVRLNTRGSMFRLSVEEANELARMLNEEGNEVNLLTGTRGDFAEFVTFHQSFAYEEFVEGLKPVTDEAGGVSYEVVPGVFRRICERARAAWDVNRDDPPKYLLVIDEINRANIAKVLGELITLVEDDKRLGQENQLTVTLPYSGARFGVPPNLYILGTMNTADRSIALLDLALRRRFTFVEMEPEPSAIEPEQAAGVDLRALLARLNERVAALLDRDHRIGHSYLMNIEDEAALRFAWYARVVPLLQEYFYNDGERLLAVLGEEFVKPAEVSDATKAALKKFTDAEPESYMVKRLEGMEFIEALHGLAGDGARAAAGVAEENQAPEEAGTEG
jgi:DNA polymerase III delta prime subunit